MVDGIGSAVQMLLLAYSGVVAGVLQWLSALLEREMQFHGSIGAASSRLLVYQVWW
jgi:hypothetical protein